MRSGQGMGCIFRLHLFAPTASMEQPPPAAAPLSAPPSAPAPAPAVPSAQALASLIASSAAAAILEPPAPAPDAQAEPPKKKTPLTGLTHKVYVGNLPEITTLADLQDCFGQFGDCSCSLKRGFGFVVSFVPPGRARIVDPLVSNSFDRSFFFLVCRITRTPPLRLRRSSSTMRDTFWECRSRSSSRTLAQVLSRRL